MSDELLVAFDIGASKISAAVAKVDDLKNMHIIAVTSVENYGIKKSVDVNMEEVVEAIRQCKTKLEGLTGVNIDEAYLGIQGGLCEIVDSRGIIQLSPEGRTVTEKDIENVKNSTKQISLSADKEIVWLSPVRYLLDSYEDIKEPLGMRGKSITLKAKLFVSGSALLSRMKECMELAGIKVLAVVPQPLALKNYIKDSGNEKICAGIINIGAETIDLSIYENGSICYTKHIPLGGNSVTRDLSACLNVSFAEAERIKLLYKKEPQESGENDSAAENITQFSKYNSNMIEEIIEARVDELLKFALEELNNNKNLMTFDCFYITGSGILHYQDNIDSFSKEMDKPIFPIRDSFEGAEDSIYCVPAGILKVVLDNTAAASKETEKFSSSGKEDNKGKKSIMSKLKHYIEDFL